MSFLKKNIELIMVLCIALLCVDSVFAQNRFAIKDYVQLNALAGVGDYAPYWLVSNRNGLSSFDTHNGYIRYGIELEGSIDKKGNWNYSSGVDLKTGYNQNHNPLVYQLYADLSYRWLTLSIGAKERQAEMRNFCSLAGVNDNKVLASVQSLSFNGLGELGTGGLAYSGNSSPVPQLRIGAPEYVTIKGTGSWLKMRGHIAYGVFLDTKFQENFTANKSTAKYNKYALYHSKSFFMEVGNVPFAQKRTVIFGNPAQISDTTFDCVRAWTRTRYTPSPVRIPCKNKRCVK
jgi:hypothetical protein